MEKLYKLSEVDRGFRGRVAVVEPDEEGVYKYYNMGFYPGNKVVVIYKGDGFSILKLGRKIVKVENSILERIYVLEDLDVAFVE